MELLDVSLANPLVRLVPERNRMATRSTCRPASACPAARCAAAWRSTTPALRAERRHGAAGQRQGQGLKLELGRHAAVRPGGAPGALLAERVLDDFVIYRVSDERRQAMARAGVNNADVAVTARGIELQFRPATALQYHPRLCRAQARGGCGLVGAGQGRGDGRRRGPDRVPADLVHRPPDPGRVAARLHRADGQGVRSRDPDRRDARRDRRVPAALRRHAGRHRQPAGRAALRAQRADRVLPRGRRRAGLRQASSSRTCSIRCRWRWPSSSAA